MTKLKATYPAYKMVKDKIALSPEIDVDAILRKLKEEYKNEDCNTIDGLKINFAAGWVHLRKSNTDPIIRVYAEGTDMETVQKLVDQVRSNI
jgi:phosphomannomutase